MKEFLVIVILFWTPVFLVLIKKYGWDLYFWQIKEYRWDRFINHITWDQDKHNRNHNSLAIKFILFAIVVLFFSLPQFIVMAAIGIAFSIWVFEGYQFLLKIQMQRAERPAIKSPRNILIIGGIFLLVSFLVGMVSTPFLSDTFRSEEAQVVLSDVLKEQFGTSEETVENLAYLDVYVYLGFATVIALFLDITTPFITAFFVFLTSPFAWIRRRITIERAKRKYAQIKDELKIVAITGSQGKTTLKEIVYELLKDEFKTEKTPENYNTDFGVAYAILNEVKKDTEVFVMEVGAYRTGEIAKVAKDFSPAVSVVTDIATQHVGLFGGHNELFMAKTELIRHLEPGGVGIINGDNKKAHMVEHMVDGELYASFTNKAEWNKTKKDKDVRVGCYLAKDIKQGKHLTFTLVDDEEDEHKVKIPVHGKHLVNLFVQAILVAKVAGIDFKKILKKLEKLDMEMPRLSIETGDNNTVVLNDSYNSSPKGFRAAVDVMNTVWEGAHEEFDYDPKSGQRIVITKGIIELGKHKKEIYEDMWDGLIGKIDVLITTDHLLEKIATNADSQIIVLPIKEYNEFVYRYRENIRPHDIVLLEGKLDPKLIAEVVSDRR